MICSRIFKKTKFFITNLVNWQVDQDDSTSFAVNQLLQGSWAIGRDDVAIIEREVDRYLQCGKISILEFGSGASTMVFIRYLNDHNLSGEITSIEADPEWIHKIKSISEKLALKDDSNITVDILRGEYSDEFGLTYDQRAVHESLNKQYDIIFIDSPPDILVEDGRLKLANGILGLLRKRGTLMIHDINRSMELYAFKILSGQFYDAELVYTSKGIGIMRFPKK